MSLMVAAPVTAQQPATRHVVWPPPPDVPRIRYVGSLSTEKDIGRGESFFGKLKRTLAGQSAPRRIGIERPFDVLVEDGERIYVTNGLINAVVVFDKSEKKARYLGEDVPGGLLKPMGLGGDGRGNVYVADPGIGRIVVFDSEGRFIRAFGTAETLRNPVDVAVTAISTRSWCSTSTARSSR
jgi:hypothetical protein